MTSCAEERAQNVPALNWKIPFWQPPSKIESLSRSKIVKVNILYKILSMLSCQMKALIRQRVTHHGIFYHRGPSSVTEEKELLKVIILMDDSSFFSVCLFVFVFF